MKKLLTTTMILATALTFNLAIAQKASALEGGPSLSPRETTLSSTNSKEIGHQAANDAVVYLADGQSTDLLNNILAELRASNAELAMLTDKEISKEIIRLVITNP